MKNISIDDLKVGAKVYWKDPEGSSSGIYTVNYTNKEEMLSDLEDAEDLSLGFYDDIYIMLGNEAGSEAEVFFHELYLTKG